MRLAWVRLTGALRAERRGIACRIPNCCPRPTERGRVIHRRRIRIPARDVTRPDEVPNAGRIERRGALSRIGDLRDGGRLHAEPVRR
jgi:hypothetical protein